MKTFDLLIRIFFFVVVVFIVVLIPDCSSEENEEVIPERHDIESPFINNGDASSEYEIEMIKSFIVHSCKIPDRYDNDAIRSYVESNYTEDAIVYPPYEEPVKGHASLVQLLSNNVYGIVPPENSEVEEIEHFGDYAYLRTFWSYPERCVIDEYKSSSGIIFTILKKQKDGNWKIWREIWNTYISAPGIYINEIQKTNTRTTGESIFIKVGEFVKDLPLDWREGYGNHLPYQLTFAFPVTLVNNGCKPFTLMNYELSPYNADYEYTFRPQDGDQGLFYSFLDSIPVNLPISIQPGEGLTVFLKTAIVIPDYDLPYELEKMNSSPTMEDLTMYYADINKTTYDESLDLFGNITDIGIGVRYWIDFELKEKRNVIQPIYHLRLISFYNNYFDTYVSPYNIGYSEPFTRFSELYPYDRNDKVLQLDQGNYGRNQKSFIHPRRRIIYE